MLRHLRLAAVGLALTQVVACAGPSSLPTDNQKGPALTIVAGNALSDTISATFTSGLVVEVRATDGGAAAGVSVQFNSVGVGGVQMAPAKNPNAPFTAGQAVLTDASGQAAVRLRFQTTPGPAQVSVTVPLYKLSDTASYTILPGAAAGFTLQPRDTTIKVGGSFRLRASVVDRVGNVRTEPISFESSAAAATVSVTGQVTGVSTGAATLRVSASAGGRVLRDSTSVAVVP